MIPDDIGTENLRVSENFENFDNIWCIDVNTRIPSLPENWGIHVNARNLVMVGMREGRGDWLIGNTRTSDIMTPLVMTGYLECYSKS